MKVSRYQGHREEQAAGRAARSNGVGCYLAGCFKSKPRDGQNQAIYFFPKWVTLPSLTAAM